MQEISPAELNQLKSDTEAMQILDVREPWEFEICRIEGSRNIPMNDIPGQLENIDREQTIAVVCHHGMRSLQIAGFLEANGFTRVLNLQGGIHAWAETVDPAMEKY
ncbi:MAG: hypothetical protein MI673_00065 [Thiotrichales bacterium]|nr:hypothetical protein [Thiotrichales bacterium]